MHRNTILLYVHVKVFVGGYFWFLGREAIMSLLWSCLKQTEPPKEYTRMLVDITANAILTTQIDPRQSMYFRLQRHYECFKYTHMLNLCFL